MMALIVKLFLNNSVQRPRSKTKDSRNSGRKEIVPEMKRKEKKRKGNSERMKSQDRQTEGTSDTGETKET
jgi:hypothetical protein